LTRFLPIASPRELVENTGRLITESFSRNVEFQKVLVLMRKYFRLQHSLLLLFVLGNPQFDSQNICNATLFARKYF
jgi:hypothetical protein